MAVVAITRILHGTADGETKEFNIGDDVSSLGDDAVRQLVEAGSAVDTTGKSKFASPLVGQTAVAEPDEDTAKRDELVAKAVTAANKSEAPAPAPETEAKK